MTQDEIIEMAEKARLDKELADDYCRVEYWTATTEELEAFAKLVAAKAIAKLESQEPVEPTEKIYKAWEILVGQHKDLLEENEKLRNQSQRTWIDLTDEQMLECNMDGDLMIDRETAKRNVEAKLKDKNT